MVVNFLPGKSVATQTKITGKKKNTEICKIRNNHDLSLAFLLFYNSCIGQ